MVDEPEAAVGTPVPAAVPPPAAEPREGSNGHGGCHGASGKNSDTTSSPLPPTTAPCDHAMPLTRCVLQRLLRTRHMTSRTRTDISSWRTSRMCLRVALFRSQHMTCVVQAQSFNALHHLSQDMKTSSVDASTAASRGPVPRGWPAAVLRLCQDPPRVGRRMKGCALAARTLTVPIELACAHYLRALRVCLGAYCRRYRNHRAPPPRLFPCSQTPAEVAGRFILGAEEDPARERRHQSAMPRGFIVDTVDTLVLR